MERLCTRYMFRLRRVKKTFLQIEKAQKKKRTLLNRKWYRKILSLIQWKELTEICMNNNIEYLQVFVFQRRLCELQINSSVVASLYIYKLKINAKLQENTLARWGISISEAKILFQCFDRRHDLKQQRNRVWVCLETIKAN